MAGATPCYPAIIPIIPSAKTMRPHRRDRPNLFFASLCLVGLCLALAGCFGEPRNVFPPRASIQELTSKADGSWSLKLRLQNFSNVAMTFAQVDGKLRVGGVDAGSITLAPNLRIGPESADVIDATLTASPAARAALAAGNVRYVLAGRIVTSEPKRDDPYEFSSQLSAVPGLPGVFR
jgi:hypothetical protein